VFLLAACGGGHHMTPEARELYHRLAERPAFCNGKQDCQVKWARAITWVREHNAIYTYGYTTTYAVRKLNNTTIETEGVGYPLFRIIKYPREDGSYGIDYQCACDGHMTCEEPNALALRASFISAVMGLPAGVKEVKPGEYSVDLNVYKFQSTSQ